MSAPARRQVSGAGAALLRRAGAWVRARAAYGLAFLPIVTDWIDTGHWPQHPREFVTEVLVGLVIFLGVFSLRRRAERYRLLSQTDSLTGLGNRARFRADLAAAVAQADEVGRGVALAIVDVDRFKDINDTLGHAAGDEVLREVGLALGRSTRQSIDGCYRLGGDEFAVLVTDAESRHVLEALRRGFDRATRALGRPVSCSVGVVTRRRGEEADALVNRADRLMYAAKRGAADSGEAQAFGHVELGRAGVLPPGSPPAAHRFPETSSCAT